MKKHGTLFILLCSAMCLLLAGCVKKTATKSQLKDDLYSSNVFSQYVNNLNMEITELEITKRQTNENQMVDTVWVEINAVCEAVEAEMYYVMTYKLYNDGWQLDTVAEYTPGQWKFIPLKSIEEESVPYHLLSYLIYNHALDFPDSFFQIENFDINERHTTVDPDAILRDTFNISATAIDDKSEIRISGEYIITYSLYDEWDVEVYVSQEDITPAKGLEIEEILAYVKSETDCDELTYVSTESAFADRTECHYVQGVKYHPYMTENCIYKISCSFSMNNYNWKINDMQRLSVEASWDAIGSWYDSGETSYLDIFKEIQTEYTIEASIYQSDDSTLSVDYDVTGIHQGKHEKGTVYFDLTSPAIDGRMGNIYFSHSSPLLQESSFLESTWLWGSAGGEVYFVFHEDLGLYLNKANGSQYFLTRES